MGLRPDGRCGVKGAAIARQRRLRDELERVDRSLRMRPARDRVFPPRKTACPLSLQRGGAHGIRHCPSFVEVDIARSNMDRTAVSMRSYPIQFNRSFVCGVDASTGFDFRVRTRRFAGTRKSLNHSGNVKWKRYSLAGL